MIGQLEEFARRVSEGLREPDWETQREIIRALVKQVEVDEGEIRIVYRVSPSPFEHGPQQGHSQHCWGRAQPDAFERLPALRAAQRVRAGGATAPEGASFLIRYADDVVMGFSWEEDARRVRDGLPKRFEKYGLTIPPEKTRLVPFERPCGDREGANSEARTPQGPSTCWASRITGPAHGTGTGW